MPSMSSGYPDGDNRPTVTMDFRRTYTMKPSDGAVSFGIGTGYAGCFIKGAGSMTAHTPFQAPRIDTDGDLIRSTLTTSASTSQTGLVPIIRVPDGNIEFPAYRPIVAVAEVTFTGSAMQNGGMVVVAKTSTANAVADRYGAVNSRLAYHPNIADPVMSGTSVVGAARDTYVSRVVPADPEFIPYQIATTHTGLASGTNVMNAYLAPGGSTGQKANSQPCPQSGAVWYSYSGLDSTATITVNVRYCVQYSVGGDSAMAPLAKPSPPPPEAPGLLSRVFSTITSSPAALNFAAGAVGHMLPSSRPLLAIAAEAYNTA